MINSDLNLCSNSADCDGKIYHIDGTIWTQASVSTLSLIKELHLCVYELYFQINYPGGVDANDRTFCMRMQANSHIGDRPCSANFKYLCQLDCSSLYSGKFNLVLK